MKFVVLGENKYDTTGYHISDALIQLGHEVILIPISDAYPTIVNNLGVYGFKVYYYMELGFQTVDNFKTKTLSTLVIDEKPDVLISLYWNINPKFTQILKNKIPSTILVHFNSDAVTNFQRQQLLVSNYDFYFTKDKFILDFLKNHVGKNTHYMPDYFNPRVHKKIERDKIELENEMNIDVSVYGNLYPYRTVILNYLKKNGVNFSIFGNKGPYFPAELELEFKNEHIKGERKAQIIYGSKVIFNNFHYAEIEGVNKKYFEIFGMGGVQVCTYKPILKEYSPVDPELYSFKNRDEALEKIQFYLNNPYERVKLSDTMYKYFKEFHTIDIRIKQILDIVFKN
jgi:spore maturation protein CgeB